MCRIKILVVEDDHDVRDLLTECLRMAGAEVRSAGTAHDALQAVEQFRPKALVCDIGLPLEDGKVLMQKIRALERARGWKPAAAIAFTGYAQSEDAERCHAAGYQAHLAIPIEPDVLVQTLSRLLAP